MIWVIIIAIVVIFVGRMLVHHKNRAEHVAREGGMDNKYRILVDDFLAGDPRARIVELDSVSVSVRLSTIGGSTTFQLVQGEGFVDVYYDVTDNPIIGKDKMHWAFPEYMNQYDMLEVIHRGLRNHNEKLLSRMSGFHM